MTAPSICWDDAPVVGQCESVVELPAATQTDEARLAMRVVDELRGRGVPPREILVVVPDIDPYERPLRRAAIRDGITPTFWVQLELVDTVAYQLFASLCDLLDPGTTSIETILVPLELGWVPPAGDDSDNWPVTPTTIRTIAHEAPDGVATLGEWHERAATAEWADDRVSTYFQWLIGRSREPSPTAVRDVFEQTLEQYRAVVLPHRKRRDDPALLETEREARAVDRMRELLDNVESKYDTWLTDARCNQSWAAVARILDRFATQRPGRREHANARAIDIVEANDAWGRTVRYVVALGLTEGCWCNHRDPYVPAEIQEAILAGSGDLSAVVPELRWGQVRHYDQFADTVAAATEAVLCTRYTGEDGTYSLDRSPVLDTITTTSCSERAAATLLDADSCVPPQLEDVLPDVGEDSPGGTDDE